MPIFNYFLKSGWDQILDRGGIFCESDVHKKAREKKGFKDVRGEKSDTSKIV